MAMRYTPTLECLEARQAFAASPSLAGTAAAAPDPDPAVAVPAVAWAPFVFPNVVGPIYPGSAIVFRVRPNGMDPDSAIKDIWTLEWPSDGYTEGKWEQRFYPDWTEKDWGEISNQDYANMLEVQSGMKSHGFRGARLNRRQESNVLHMHRTIDRYVSVAP